MLACTYSFIFGELEVVLCIVDDADVVVTAVAAIIASHLIVRIAFLSPTGFVFALCKCNISTVQRCL